LLAALALVALLVAQLLLLPPLLDSPGLALLLLLLVLVLLLLVLAWAFL
jgi:hypothetical protein